MAESTDEASDVRRVARIHPRWSYGEIADEVGVEESTVAEALLEGADRERSATLGFPDLDRPIPLRVRVEADGESGRGEIRDVVVREVADDAAFSKGEVVDANRASREGDARLDLADGPTVPVDPDIEWDGSGEGYRPTRVDLAVHDRSTGGSGRGVPGPTASRARSAATLSRASGLVGGAARRVARLVRPGAEEDTGRAWHRVMIYAIVGWWVALLAIGALPDGNPLRGLFALVWLAATFVPPVALYLDIRHVRAETEWDPSAVLYLVGFFLLFFVAVPLYLYRRREVLGI